MNEYTLPDDLVHLQVVTLWKNNLAKIGLTHEIDLRDIWSLDEFNELYSPYSELAPEEWIQSVALSTRWRITLKELYGLVKEFKLGPFLPDREGTPSDIGQLAHSMDYDFSFSGTRLYPNKSTQQRSLADMKEIPYPIYSLRDVRPNVILVLFIGHWWFRLSEVVFLEHQLPELAEKVGVRRPPEWLTESGLQHRLEWQDVKWVTDWKPPTWLTASPVCHWKWLTPEEVCNRWAVRKLLLERFVGEVGLPAYRYDSVKGTTVVDDRYLQQSHLQDCLFRLRDVHGFERDHNRELGWDRAAAIGWKQLSDQAVYFWKRFPSKDTSDMAKGLKKILPGMDIATEAHIRRIIRPFGPNHKDGRPRRGAKSPDSENWVQSY